MGVGTGYQNVVVNALLKGSTSPLPAAWGIQLCSTVPTDSSLVELATGIGYTPQSGQFGVATSGTATNSVAATFGPFSSTETFSGGGIKDTTATGGTNIFNGSLSAAVTMTPGEFLVFAVGAIACSVA
jgi:hypothetical protein